MQACSALTLLGVSPAPYQSILHCVLTFQVLGGNPLETAHEWMNSVRQLEIDDAMSA